MNDLLNQLSTLPPLEHALTILLVLISFFSLMFVIISLAPNSNPKSDLKLAFIMLTVFIVSTFILYSNTDRVNTIRNSVINNKKYQLNLKGSILELTSSTPYIESKTLKVIYQDNKRIQVEYKGNYFEIDKSQLNQSSFKSIFENNNNTKTQYISNLKYFIENIDLILLTIKNENKEIVLTDTNSKEFGIYIEPDVNFNNKLFIHIANNVIPNNYWQSTIQWIEV